MNLSLIGSAIANPDELRLMDNSSKYDHFPTFLLTNVLDDQDDNFKDARYLEVAPGRSVCSSVPNYIAMKNGYENGKICRDNPPTVEGFKIGDMILVGGVMGLLGATIALMSK